VAFALLELCRSTDRTSQLEYPAGVPSIFHVSLFQIAWEGTNGTNGKFGKNGTNGKLGTNGINGTNGTLGI